MHRFTPGTCDVRWTTVGSPAPQRAGLYRSRHTGLHRFVKPCPGCGRSSRVRVDSAGAPVPSSTALTERTGMTLRDHPEPCHPIRRIFIAERCVLCDSLAVRHGVVAQRHDVGFGAPRDRRRADSSSEAAARGACSAKILVYADALCENWRRRDQFGAVPLTMASTMRAAWVSHCAYAVGKPDRRTACADSH